MANKSFIRVALPTPLRRLFDYLPPQEIDLKDIFVGARIRVPFQSRQLVGIVAEIADQSDVPIAKLKQAHELIDTLPLFSKDIHQICEWAAQYYHASLGEVLIHALPSLLRRGKTLPEIKPLPIKNENRDKLPLLNAAQAGAVKAITDANTFHVFLLDGVTGSGKTEVYLRAIADQLALGKQALVLVPEISLTPQTVRRFSNRFSVPVAALHSSLTDRERLNVWLAAREGMARIVIGTRSAIFTPFKNLGLIVVDEEHDQSFKQQDRFRYHARDLAVMRANFLNIPVVLGSATPSLESLLNVKRQRYTCLSLLERAGNAQLPQYELIDLRREKQDDGLSKPLLEDIHKHLEKQHQVMLFLNRRGFAPVMYCAACHNILNCKRCDARMVYHRVTQLLKCHHCDAQQKVPVICQQCQSSDIAPIGVGTQRIEEVLKSHFPQTPILRVDRDNTRKKGALDNLLAEINEGKPAILLGTQMLAKGHHFPNVTLVGVVDADAGLFSVDFRAIEQMGQLLMQVAGRAGRADKLGKVVIQTRHPEHPLLQTLIQQNYAVFAELIMTEREIMRMPPFSYFALLRAEAYKEKSAVDFLMAVKNLCDELSLSNMMVLGPTPALMAKRKGLYCHQLVLKAGNRRILQDFLKYGLARIEALAKGLPVKWIIDVDPVEVV